jgi:hypothetical protein
MDRRPSITSVLSFAIGACILWQFQRSGLFDPNRGPGLPTDEFLGLARLTFLGVFAIFALRFVGLLTPLVSWGVEQLRRRQMRPDLGERLQARSQTEPQPDLHCPNCGASIFDDSASCPWCGQPLS